MEKGDDKGVKVWGLIVILAVVVAVFSGVVSADQSCTLYAVADGYAWSGGTENPSGASSTADYLRVGFRTASGNYRTLIKFDLSSIPTGATITSADLKLYYYAYVGTAGDPLYISVYRTTVDWNEGYLSWSKAENYNSFSYDTVTIIAGGGAGYKAWDITSLVQNWVDGTYNNYGVLLRAPTQSGSSIYRSFRSKEYGSNPPKLEVTYTTEQELLPAPTLISPYNGEIGVSTSPYFDWSSVSGATHYWLMVAANENDLPDDPNAETCPNCVISQESLISTSYTPSTALAEGTTYYWQVQAYEWDGSSVTRQGEYSEHYSFTTEESLLPAPNLYSPADNAQDESTTPYFDWSSVSGANRYWLMVAANENDLPDDPSAVSCPNCVISQESLISTSYTPSTALAEGTTYYWQVQAYEWDGSSVTRQGEYSEHYSFTTEVSLLPAPNLYSPYNGETGVSTTPDFDWSDISSANRYWLMVAENEGDLPTDPYATSCPNCVISEDDITSSQYLTPAYLELDEGKTYYWQVQAFEWDGSSVTRQGEYSEHYSFTTEEYALKVKGIDISHYQNDAGEDAGWPYPYIYWDQVYDAGKIFAFVKATQDHDYVDPHFEINMEYGNDTGLLMGAYHFAEPNGGDAVAEAQHFVSVAGDYITDGYLRPILDVETPPGYPEPPLPWNELSDWIHDWMNTVENETGVEPIIYVNRNYAKNLDESIVKYNLWIAKPEGLDKPPTPEECGIWDDWDFWQYSWEGSVPGISGNVDLDIFNGNMSMLNTFIISVPNQPPTCAIELREQGTTFIINEINVGQFFDIYAGDSTDDQGIREVRFSSDESQDGNPTGTWTSWYDWDTSSGDWNAISKIKAWLFATEGNKEVWAEVKDDADQTRKCSANIFANQPIQPPTVTTNAATLVEETTATLNGVINNDGGEACQYLFEYDTNSGEPYAYNTGWTGSKTTGQSFSASIPSLAKGTKYYFRAQARNSAGTASGSELTFLTKPDAPTSFSATTAGTTQIDLSWTKGAGAQKTKIQRKEGGYPIDRNDGTEVYFDTGSSTSDTGLTPGTTYYYRAWSYVQGSEQWSDNYTQASATTTSIGAPTVTTNAATNIGTDSAQLNGYLDDMGGADSCEVRFVWDTSYHSDYKDYDYSTSSQTKYSTGSFEDSINGLEPDTTYHFRAVASNSKGTDCGDDMTFTTSEVIDTTPPTWDTKIGIQSATDTGNGGRVTVTYGTATDADSPPVKYNVYYSTSSPATGGTKLSNVGSSPYTVTGLTNGLLYYFSVRAEDSATSSNEDTNTVEVAATPTAPDTTPPIISNVQATSITTSSATITWETDEVSDSLVKYGTTSGIYTLTSSDTANITSHSISLMGLSANTTYYYAVNSTDPSGNSNESGEYRFTTATAGAIFDTGHGTYPSIRGTHTGTITPSHDINVTRMYTYPCFKTDGHSEHVKFYNDTWSVEANWIGTYLGNYQWINFDTPFTLLAGHTYNYTIITGCYPQIHHSHALDTGNGTITCTEFVDANGKSYNDWIPAFRLRS